jgi:signal peptidase II
MKLRPLNAKEIVALRVCAIAFLVWLLDYVSKFWAHEYLGKEGITILPNLLVLVRGINYGGSNGIPSAFMEFCLTVPAVLMFIVALSLGKSLRSGKTVNSFQQLGLGLFFGGALGNWSERVLHGGVTDMVWIPLFGGLIFNLADICIDFGNLILIIEICRMILTRKKSIAPD